MHTYIPPYLHTQHTTLLQHCSALLCAALLCAVTLLCAVDLLCSSSLSELSSASPRPNLIRVSLSATTALQERLALGRPPPSGRITLPSSVYNRYKDTTHSPRLPTYGYRHSSGKGPECRCRSVKGKRTSSHARLLNAMR